MMGTREGMKGEVEFGDLGSFPVLGEGEEADLARWERRTRKRAQYGRADKEWFAQRFAALGMSQNDAARLVGLHAGKLSKVFAGQAQMTVPVLKKLASLLGEPMQVVAVRCGY